MSRRSDAGFTMIEMVVSLVLSAIVLALIIGGLVSVLGSSDRSAAKTTSQRSASAAADQLVADLRAARAPQREPIFTGSQDNLRRMLLGNEDGGMLVHDVVEATSTRVMFSAELVNQPLNTANTAECVTWEVTTTGSIQRTVQPGPACPTNAAPLQRTEVMPAPAANASAAVTIPQPFSYKLLRQTDRTNPNPAACTTPTVKNATSKLDRDQITGVRMDLRSFIARRSGRGDTSLVTAASIVARQSLEYRYAIGCVS